MTNIPLSPLQKFVIKFTFRLVEGVIANALLRKLSKAPSAGKGFNKVDLGKAVVAGAIVAKPSLLYKPLSAIRHNLIWLGSTETPDPIVSAEIVAEYFGTFNSSQCLIVARALLSNAEVKPYVDVFIFITILIIFRYFRVILKLIFKYMVSPKENYDNELGKQLMDLRLKTLDLIQDVDPRVQKLSEVKRMNDEFNQISNLLKLFLNKKRDTEAIL